MEPNNVLAEAQAAKHAAQQAADAGDAPAAVGGGGAALPDADVGIGAEPVTDLSAGAGVGSGPLDGIVAAGGAGKGGGRAAGEDGVSAAAAATAAIDALVEQFGGAEEEEVRLAIGLFGLAFSCFDKAETQQTRWSSSLAVLRRRRRRYIFVFWYGCSSLLLRLTEPRHNSSSFGRSAGTAFAMRRCSRAGDVAATHVTMSTKVHSR